MVSDADRLDAARAEQQERRRVRDQDEAKSPPTSRACALCAGPDHREWAH